MSDNDPLQTVFDLSEAMLDQIEILSGLILSTRLVLQGTASADALTATDALLSSMTFHATRLRDDVITAQAATMGDARDL